MSRVRNFQGAGVRIAGEEWEPEGAEPRGTVLLCHGGGQTRHSWRSTGAWLARAGWRAIALDTRGHGDSGWSTDGVYTIDLFVNDLRAVIDTLSDPPVVIGASLGGTTAMILGGEDPGTLRALVLVDIAPRVEPDGAKRIKQFMSAAPDGFASLEEVSESIHRYNPHRPRPSNLEGLKKNLRLSDNGRWYWHWDPQMLSLPEEPRGGSGEARVYAAAEALDVPVLIVRGSQSDILTNDGVQELLDLVPSAKFVQVTAGHMVAGDDNHVFTSNVGEFLESVYVRERERSKSI